MTGETAVVWDGVTVDGPLSWKLACAVTVRPFDEDLFGSAHRIDQIADAFALMGVSGRHTFHITTGRPSRAQSLLDSRRFWRRVGAVADALGMPLPECGESDDPRVLPNVRVGVSCSDQGEANTMVPRLLEVPAAMRYLELTGLSGPIDLKAPGSQWLPSTEGRTRAGKLEGRFLDPVILTTSLSEQGNAAWTRVIRDQCETSGVPFVGARSDDERGPSYGRTSAGASLITRWRQIGGQVA